MATPKNTIKSWFVTAAKPLQAHFWAWMDSYWHKDEAIPMASVEGLIDALNSISGEVLLTFSAAPDETWTITADCLVIAILITCTDNATVTFGPSGSYGTADVTAGVTATIALSKMAFANGEELLMETSAGTATIKILKRNIT